MAAHPVSDDKDVKAYMCFESGDDADIWDNQT
jgi:hypothetical protein